MVTSVMPLGSMTDKELVRHVDNSGDATPLERVLANRLDAYLVIEERRALERTRASARAMEFARK